MIDLPKRSVTRFFIPLIDVLILLFCIFLLMPLVSRKDDSDLLAPGGPLATAADSPREEADRLRREVGRLNEELRELRQRQGALAENLSVLALQIDRSTGELIYFDPARDFQRVVIDSQAEARRLIEQHQKQAGTREPFFLIQYPRAISGYPLQGQVDTYRRWFKDASYGFDNPLAGG